MPLEKQQIIIWYTACSAHVRGGCLDPEKKSTSCISVWQRGYAISLRRNS